MMIVGTIVSVATFLVLVGGLGWKLSTSLSDIREMLRVFIAKAEAKFDILEKFEARLEKIETRILEIEKEHLKEHKGD